MMEFAYKIRNFDEKEFALQESPHDKIKFLLKYAILAPSTHNSQPWLFKIEPGSVKIFYDNRLVIREADPMGRDLYVSLGCLIENLVTAAQYFGVFDDVRYYDNRETKLVAEVFFKDLSVGRSLVKYDDHLLSLLGAIKTRVNARGLFLKKPVPHGIIEQFQKANDFDRLELALIEDRPRIEALAKLTIEGLRIAYRSRDFRKEMSYWVHHNANPRRHGIPGYSLRLGNFMSRVFPFVMRWFNIGTIVGRVNYKSVASSPLIAVIGAEENSKYNWLDVGRLAQRIMLEAFASGLKTSIFVAAIEMGELHKKVKVAAGLRLAPQFLLCVGYMDFNQAPNPRHPVEKKLIL